MTKVKARKMYYDRVLERDIIRGEIYEVADDRATALENQGFVVVVEYPKRKEKDGNKDSN